MLRNSSSEVRDLEMLLQNPGVGAPDHETAAKEGQKQSWMRNQETRLLARVSEV